MNTSTIKNRSILIVIPAEEFNEREFSAVKSLFEKKGFRVFIASDANSLCLGGRGMKVRADVNFYNLNSANFSAAVIIGGLGIEKYYDNHTLQSFIGSMLNDGKIVGAICLAPVVLARGKYLSGKKAVCYETGKTELKKNGAFVGEDSLMEDGLIITAKDEESADDFAALLLHRITSR